MKIATLFLPLLFFSTFSFGQWVVDKDHSKIAFIVDHHGISEVDGYFKKFEAKITAGKADLSDAVFEVTVETASIFTDLEERDNELKDKDLFDVKKFPLMTFKSTSFKKVKDKQYKLIGNLTMKGVTKEVVIPFTFMKLPEKTEIKGTFTINRRDYGVGGSSMTMADNAIISIDILLGE